MRELLHHLQALPALTRVGAGEDLTRGRGENHLGLAPTDCYAVDVRVAQPTGDGRPGLPAIQAPAHPIHLDARPDGPVVLRVHHERGHPGDDHRRALFGQFHGQLFPPLAAVLGAEHRRRFGPGKDGPRLGRINGQGPGVHGVHRRVQSFPTRPAVLTTIHPRVGAGVYDVRFPGVHRQRPDIVFRVATGPDPGPGLPAIRAPPDPRPDRTDTYGNVLLHNTSSPHYCLHLDAMPRACRVTQVVTRDHRLSR